MECPICGARLPHLASLLARTEAGTQCPQCWARLRWLAPEPVTMEKKLLPRRRIQPRRRAA